MYETVLYTKEDKTALLTLNRPQVLNALNRQMLYELEHALDEITSDSAVRSLIITGTGRAFAAGADIAYQANLNIEEAFSWSEYGSSIFQRLEELSVPTIAAINGFALGGGCELAMACDILLASDTAKLGQPETGLGITPGFSGTQRLLRKVGASKAKELIFTGETIDAREALSLGLVNKVVPGERLMEEAFEMASKINKNAPIAVRYAKKAINHGAQVDMNSAIKIENGYFSMCFATEDQKEGMKAFLEKRKADFKNQ